MNEYLTYEECLAAVQKDGYLIEFVPEHLKTPDIIAAAIDSNDPDAALFTRA